MKKDEVPAARILLVDDNSHGMTARKLILTDHGYEVETAKSGEEAWDIFQKNNFDIVVTDLRMSGIDGVELIRRIRAADAPARTILLSGFIGCLGMTEQSTGADELICKSNKEVPELLRAIKKLATRPRSRGVRSQGAPDGSKVMRAKINQV
jgi:CheY-like chemotaxis protein